MSKLPKRKTLSPQQKKQMSLKKDRRENYGRNDKASRRLVPLRKAQAQRLVRRLDKQILAGALDDPEMDTVSRVRPSRDGFRKWPGVSLQDDIAASALAALKRDGRKTRTRAQEIEWFERFYGAAIAARMRALYISYGWIEE